MKIKRAIILGAGYGSRLRPVTLKIPKPLIKINGVTLLENSIKLLNSLGVKHIIVNAHHLHRQIIKFVKGKKFSSKVDVVVEKKKILNTGGGILNASKKFKKQPFFVLNPDTLWNLKKCKKEFRKLEKLYFKNKKPTMLLVSKKKSFDRSFKGDFNLNSKNEILREKNNKFIFIGAQIINRSVFKKRKIKPFSMNKVWDDLIKERNLLGVVSRKKFFHINNYKIYKKLNKKVIG
jgi:MurNAc alpha-1-phosphate uridylyltransferase